MSASGIFKLPSRLVLKSLVNRMSKRSTGREAISRFVQRPSFCSKPVRPTFAFSATHQRFGRLMPRSTSNPRSECGYDALFGDWGDSNLVRKEEPSADADRRRFLTLAAKLGIAVPPVVTLVLTNRSYAAASGFKPQNPGNSSGGGSSSVNTRRTFLTSHEGHGSDGDHHRN